MNQITIPLNPSQEDLDTLRNLFNKYSKAKQGFVNQEQLTLLILELANKPPSYQIAEVFKAGESQEIDQNSFLFWYLSGNIGIPRLSDLFFGLKRFEKEIESAAPPDAGKQTIKQSFIKLSSEVDENTLSNQVYFDILLNPNKTKARLNKYSEILKKQINPFAVALNFHVDANPGDIKEKVEALIGQLRQLATQMLGPQAGFLDLVDIDVGNSDTEIIIVISSQYIVFKLLAEQFDRVISLVSPTIHAQASVLIKSDAIGKILGNAAEGLNASSAIDIKIDSILMARLKEVLYKVNAVPDSFKYVFGYLLEQVKLELKLNSIKEHVTQSLGLPGVNIAAQMGGIKQQVDIPGIIETFLPPSSQELIQIMKNAQSTNITADLFLGCFNFRANFALAGTNEVLSSIL